LENEALGESALVGFVTKLAKRLGNETGGSDEASDPKLHQRGMLWINLKCAVFDIKNAGGNVVGLVKGESVEPGGDGGAKYAEGHEEQHQPGEQRSA